MSHTHKQSVRINRDAMESLQNTGSKAKRSAQPHLGPMRDETLRREKFAARELATILSHYEIGIIQQIKDYPRGSRRAPKLRIVTESGEYLLKRRAPGRDDPYRVAFAHRLQLQLAEHAFPVPRLIGTRDDNNSMAQLNGKVYEMFEFVRGDFFNNSNRASQYSGYTLAKLHSLLRGHEIIYNPPEGSYHGAAGIHGHIAAIPRSVTTVDVEVSESGIVDCCSFLRNSYEDAASKVNELGFNQWRERVIHGDWHPGNLLFKDHKVIAVIDFDSARLEPRIVDIANGALQFSMQIGDAERPETWPEGLATERIRAFVHGYDQGSAEPITELEYQALPWLIIEALIAESVVPIAATGSFARISGWPFLTMIEKKVQWMQPRASKLIKYIRKR